MAARNDRWSLVVPVKRLAVAKSRIALTAADRAELALAMAMDTVAAGAACRLVGVVVVVSDDPRAAEAVAGPGVVVVADVPDAGLNPALRHGAATAGHGRIVAVSSDLPALRPTDLEVVLTAAHAHVSGVVADDSGVGTTLLTAASPEDFAPRFGPDSFRTHRRDGAVDLTASAAPSVRRDVDTVEELRTALSLGVGARTQAVVASLGSRLG